MADPQHVEWLKEGVEAWNRRRQEFDFRPDLGEAKLGRAKLIGAKLGGANLRGADLRRADLREADLREADLRRAKLLEAKLGGADLGGASIKSVNTGLSANDGVDPVFTDLSQSFNLTSRQIATMFGDTGVILPDGMKHPDDWPDWVGKPEIEESPNLPDKPAFGEQIEEIDGRITLSSGSAPEREELAGLLADLRDDVADLQSIGNLSNTSPVLAKALDRLLRTIPEHYEDFEQVRFAVAAEKMHRIFATARDDLIKEASEKVGFVDAVLYAADLLKARLPDWGLFLAETADASTLLSENEQVFKDIVNETIDGVRSAPESYDPSVAERLEEYIEGSDVEGDLAAKTLIEKLAHWVFSQARELSKDLVSATRKMVIKGIAGTFLASLGGACLRLAGLLPNELPWILRWLEYLPTLL